eukprot:gnl/MRDRNA2_/MRDRNA2_30020_c0_seq1.p1 gnl/MRDRNA2_/MRDRNA2_30020_c0~~gnl/MRDRNA2_/MRDRNA2_30020_c0_seq1.p1  ORF type:complete len:1247 (+),score=393.73 gnl/MRDRNA2_/MRDRNA2_30020_c0_seq1:452-3742(+)
MSDLKIRYAAAEANAITATSVNQGSELRNSQLTAEIRELHDELQESRKDLRLNLELVATLSEKQETIMHSEGELKIQAERMRLGAEWEEGRWREELQSMQKTLTANLGAAQAFAAEECKVLRDKANVECHVQAAAVEKCNSLQGEVDIFSQQIARLENQVHIANAAETRAATNLDEKRGEVTRLCFSIAAIEAESAATKDKQEVEIAQIRCALEARDSQNIEQAAEFRGALAGRNVWHQEEMLEFRQVLKGKDDLSTQLKEEIANLQMVVNGKDQRIDGLLNNIKAQDEKFVWLRSVAATTESEHRTMSLEIDHHKQEAAQHQGEAGKLRGGLASQSEALAKLDAAHVHQSLQSRELLAECKEKAYRHEELTAELIDSQAKHIKEVAKLHQEITDQRRESLQLRKACNFEEEQLHNAKKLENNHESCSSELTAELGEKSKLLTEMSASVQARSAEIHDLFAETNSKNLAIKELKALLTQQQHEAQGLLNDKYIAEDKHNVLLAEIADIHAESVRLAEGNTDKSTEIARLQEEIQTIEYIGQTRNEDLMNQVREMQAKAEDIRSAALKQEAESLKILHDADYRGHELLQLIGEYELQEGKCLKEEKTYHNLWKSEQEAMMEERRRRLAAQSEADANASALSKANLEINQLSAKAQELHIVQVDLLQERAMSEEFLQILHEYKLQESKCVLQERAMQDMWKAEQEVMLEEQRQQTAAATLSQASTELERLSSLWKSEEQTMIQEREHRDAAQREASANAAALLKANAELRQMSAEVARSSATQADLTEEMAISAMHSQNVVQLEAAVQGAIGQLTSSVCAAQAAVDKYSLPQNAAGGIAVPKAAAKAAYAALCKLQAHASDPNVAGLQGGSMTPLILVSVLDAAVHATVAFEQLSNAQIEVRAKMKLKEETDAEQVQKENVSAVCGAAVALIQEACQSVEAAATQAAMQAVAFWATKEGHQVNVRELKTLTADTFMNLYTPWNSNSEVMEQLEHKCGLVAGKPLSFASKIYAQSDTLGDMPGRRSSADSIITQVSDDDELINTMLIDDDHSIHAELLHTRLQEESVIEKLTSEAKELRLAQEEQLAEQLAFRTKDGWR